MSHAKNKVKWCLKKAKKELKERGKHRGLIQVKPTMENARKHIAKAEHNLRAMIDFKKGEFSDWCAPAAFYAMYHGLLAILSKFGYETENQECTFALIYSLIEDGNVDLKKEIIDKIAEFKPERQIESKTIVNIREHYQYGTKLSIEDNTYNELLEFVKNVIADIKHAIEK